MLTFTFFSLYRCTSGLCAKCLNTLKTLTHLSRHVLALTTKSQYILFVLVNLMNSSLHQTKSICVLSFWYR